MPDVGSILSQFGVGVVLSSYNPETCEQSYFTAPSVAIVTPLKVKLSMLLAGNPYAFMPLPVPCAVTFSKCIPCKRGIAVALRSPHALFLLP